MSTGINTLTEPVSPHPDIRICSLMVDEGVMTAELDGQIRHQSVAGLQEFFFSRITAHNPQQLVLDFQRISFVDSQGLAFLIALYKYCAPVNCAISIRSANSHVSNLVRMTRMTAFLKLI